MNPKVSITKTYTFEAAHQLPNHDGQCARLHGHSYKLEVTISGNPHPADGSASEGMVMDFKDLGIIVKKEVLEKFDHQYLNDIVDYVSTCENLALDIFTRLQKGGLSIEKVKLWETAKAYATITHSS